MNPAVHRKDFTSAVQYLQITPNQRPNGERLARDLTYLIDGYFAKPITSVSDAPAGAPDDGLPANRERIVLTIDEQPVDIELVRVKDPQAGQVWLISSQTLAAIPAIRRSATGAWFDRFMPESLVESTVLGVPIARWVAWAATIVVPFAGLWLVSSLFIMVARLTVTDAVNRKLLEWWYAELHTLAIVIATLGTHVVLMRSLGFSLSTRVTYNRIALVVAVLIASWLLWRLVALSIADASLLAQRKGQTGFRSLLLLAERVCKAVIVVVAIFTILTIAGVNTTTALAGVGIGGVAVALGAQKTVENLLGGVFLLSDRALAVGDTCSISDRLGVVEDVTMRSVRLRTIEQTLLSVPAGTLSQSNVENFATRNKILVNTTLRLSYGTTADQLRRVLSAVRALLDQRADIETATARIRLVDFGERAIDLELFAYVLTADFLKFLAVREELLLQIATIVESSGTVFAQQTIVFHDAMAAAATR